MRAALLHLAAGFLLGALLLFNKGVPVSGGLWRWLPVHSEFLRMGWTAQPALGVAYWILPSFHSERSPVAPRVFGSGTPAPSMDFVRNLAAALGLK